MKDSSQGDLPEDQLPHEVVAALRERHSPPVTIPAKVDESILADARAQLQLVSKAKTQPQRAGRFRWIALSSGTLAAAVLLFALLPGSNELPQTRDMASALPASRSAGPQATLSDSVNSADVDQNGDINILDAFALARQLGSPDADRWDQNGDNQTNQADVDLIAMNVVTL